MSDLGRSAMRVIDEHLVALNRSTAAHEDHLKAHDEMNAIINRRIDALHEFRIAKDKDDSTRNKRINRLVERVDTLYARIHAIEKKMRE